MLVVTFLLIGHCYVTLSSLLTTLKAHVLKMPVAFTYSAQLGNETKYRS